MSFIERAIYGVPSGREADVTGKVRDLVNAGSPSVLVDYATFGDPVPCHRKRLAVWLKGRGLVEAWEGTVLSLPIQTVHASTPFFSLPSLPEPLGLSWAAAEAGPWRKVDGAGMTTVSVGTDGAIWGISANQSIWRRASADAPWASVPGQLVQVSCASASLVVGVNVGGDAWRFKAQTGGWDQLPGSGWKWMDIGTDGSVWGVKTGGGIFRWNMGGSWDAVPGHAIQVSVGDASNVWAVTADGCAYRWTGLGWMKIPAPEPLACVTVGPAGRRVVGLQQDGRVRAWTGTEWLLLAGPTGATAACWASVGVSDALLVGAASSAAGREVCFVPL